MRLSRTGNSIRSSRWLRVERANDFAYHVGKAWDAFVGHGGREVTTFEDVGQARDGLMHFIGVMMNGHWVTGIVSIKVTSLLTGLICGAQNRETALRDAIFQVPPTNSFTFPCLLVTLHITPSCCTNQ